MKAIIIILSIYISTACYACDCIWGGSFLHSLNSSDIAIVGTIISYDQFYCAQTNDSTIIYKPTIMVVQVEEVLFANTEKFSYIQNIRISKLMSIRVLGNINNTCSPDIEIFSLGSVWLLKMNLAKENYYAIDFIISDCASNYLRVANDTVIGNIEGENQRLRQEAVNIMMPMGEIREKIALIRKMNIPAKE